MVARFNLELAPEAKSITAQIMTKTGLRTQAAVFENALALLSWAVREVSRGRVIASLDEEKKHYAELHMPALMGAKHRSSTSRTEATSEAAPEAEPANGKSKERRQHKKEAVFVG